LKAALRVKIYEYLEARELILEIGKLSKTERKLLKKDA
jgi:hypothetical protein